MRPLLLHLDDALERQPRLIEAMASAGARVVDAKDVGPSVRLWGTAEGFCGFARPARLGRAGVGA